MRAEPSSRSYARPYPAFGQNGTQSGVMGPPVAQRVAERPFAANTPSTYRWLHDRSSKAVPHQITIAKTLDLTAVLGLMPPPWARTPPHPLCWVEDDTKKIPKIVRFIWLPITGEMRVGVQCRHALQVPHGHQHPLAAWLRGIYAPLNRCLVLGSYYWSASGDDAFGAEKEALHRGVSQQFLMLLRPHLPPRTLVYGMDNEFLKQRFPHLPAPARW